MTDEFTSPFVPGSRVAVQSGYTNDWREDFVDKVYKTGRFTLRSDQSKPPSQWRPNSYRSFSANGEKERPLRWTAHKTGERWNRSHLKLWDDEADKEISEAIAETGRKTRWRRLNEKLNKLRGGEITDAFLDKIEEALSVNSKIPTKEGTGP